MDYRTLGRSGCAVSTLALGTMTFGAETDEAGSHEQLDRFVEAGGTLVDTADVYGGGRPRRSSAGGSPTGRPMSPSGWCWRPRAASRWATTPNALGLSAPASDPGAGRVAAAGSGWTGRSVPGTRVRPVDAAGGDAADPRRLRPRRQDPLLRAVQLHRLAADQDGAPGPGAGRRGAGDAAAAVQPARARDRVGDRAGRPGRRARAAAVEPARRRLAVGQVPARRAARPAPPGSARTRTAAWRPTTGAAPSAPGRSSTPCSRSPRIAASRWPRSRWPGSPTGRR